MELKSSQVEFFDKYGFIGVDASLEISLFEYGMLYSEKIGVLLIPSMTVENRDTDVEYADSEKIINSKDGALIKFDFTFVKKADVIEKLKDLGKGFYSYIDQEKDACIKSVEEGKIIHLVIPIHNIETYCSGFTEVIKYEQDFSYDSLEEVFKVIEEYISQEEKSYNLCNEQENKVDGKEQ